VEGVIGVEKPLRLSVQGAKRHSHIGSALLNALLDLRRRRGECCVLPTSGGSRYACQQNQEECLMDFQKYSFGKAAR
jgi:hypothetical protein